MRKRSYIQDGRHVTDDHRMVFGHACGCLKDSDKKRMRPLPTSKKNSLKRNACPHRNFKATSAYVSIRQHTSAYVSIRQHTSAYVIIRQHT
jgi:hypothetical protein